jgi:hypothetical protein
LLQLLCSSCGKEIFGSVIIVSDAGDDAEMQWGEMKLYYSTPDGQMSDDLTAFKPFVLLHPNCFTSKFVDEILRQERSAIITVGFMKVEDAREALRLV